MQNAFERIETELKIARASALEALLDDLKSAYEKDIARALNEAIEREQSKVLNAREIARFLLITNNSAFTYVSDNRIIESFAFDSTNEKVITEKSAIAYKTQSARSSNKTIKRRIFK